MYERELALDLPITYKTVSVYPVVVSDKWEFERCIGVLCINKSSIDMSYLKFIMTLDMFAGDTACIDRVTALFRVCLKTDNTLFFWDENEKARFSVDGAEMTAKDFKEIRDIICLQNNVSLEFDDLRVPKGDDMRPFEEQITAVSLECGITLADVQRLTLRKFSQYLDLIYSRARYFTRHAELVAGAKNDEKLLYWFKFQDNRFYDYGGKK